MNHAEVVYKISHVQPDHLVSLRVITKMYSQPIYIHTEQKTYSHHLYIHTEQNAYSLPFYMYKGGSRGLVVKVLDSKFEGCEFKTHTGHGSFSKLRQFRLPYFASVYSAANEYKHCLEGICDGLVSRPGESV